MDPALNAIKTNVHEDLRIARAFRISTIVFLLSISFLTVLPSGFLKSSAESVGPWTGTTSYPENIVDHSCVVYSGFIYCVGGYTGSNYVSDVYFAQVSSAGVGAWNKTTSYPTAIEIQSCAAYIGYIYCVGGNTGSSDTSAVYYASISASGVGLWKNTTAYPLTIAIESCAIYSGYIYCVGGANGMGSPVDLVYYASVSSSGVGAWTATTVYPSGVFGESCQTYAGYIYCVGDINAAYYAPVSASGVGTWTETTDYPTNGVFETSCAISSGYMYCVAGSTGAGYTDLVYYATLSSAGIGTWTATSSYPLSVIFHSCGAYIGYIYCVGGVTSLGTDTNAVYYTEIPPPGITVVNSQSAAGYVLSSTTLGSVTQVKGSWTVPAVSCSSIPVIESIAVSVSIDGRDGFMVESTCENGDAFYPASYLSGGSSTAFNSVNPGDQLEMSVKYSKGAFHMTFTDVTGGWSSTFKVSDASAPRESALWILQLVRSPLVDFGFAYSGKVYTGVAGTDNAVIAGQSGVIGSFAGTSVEVQQLNMVDSTASLMASASSLSKTGSSFYVQWIAGS